MRGRRFPFLLSFVVLGLAVVTGCGSSGTPPVAPPPVPAAPAAAAAPAPVVMSAMALNLAFNADEAKSQAEYASKPFVLQNLLPSNGTEDDKTIVCHPYDPATKEGGVPGGGDLMLLQEPIKTSQVTNFFNLHVTDPKLLEGIPLRQDKTEGGKDIIAYQCVIDVEGTFLGLKEGTFEFLATKATKVTKK